MTATIDKVLSEIDKEELIELVKHLGNIDSPPHHETEVAEFIESWLKKEGIKTKVLSLIEDRPNVIGTIKGTGGGYSLLFNSHMDTAVSEHNVFSRRNYMEPIFHQAWQDGERLFGTGVVNDKGPMACFLIAAKAIKEAGITLKGDLLLTAVSGEIAWEPVDEFKSPWSPGHAVGARFISRHGAIADYAVVAESTGSTFAWVQAGKLFVKITVFGGDRIYTPFLKGPYTLGDNPNAIVRMTSVVQKLQEWASTYEKQHTYAYPGGTLIPKVAIGAIRGGEPYNIDGTSEICSIYVDIRTLPGQDFLAIKEELNGIIQSLALDGEVEITVSEPGYEAKNIDCLAESVQTAYKRIFNQELKPAVGPYCSMWRDMNVFNEIGIPTLTYGPTTLYGPAAGGGRTDYYMHVDDLYKTAQTYALVALDICTLEKKPETTPRK